MVGGMDVSSRQVAQKDAMQILTALRSDVEQFQARVARRQIIVDALDCFLICVAAQHFCAHAHLPQLRDLIEIHTHARPHTNTHTHTRTHTHKHTHHTHTTHTHTNAQCQ